MHLTNSNEGDDEEEKRLVSFGMCLDTFGILLSEFERWRVAFAFQFRSPLTKKKTNVNQAKMDHMKLLLIGRGNEEMRERRK